MNFLRISRREFFKWMGSLSGIVALLLWLQGTKRNLAVNSPSKITLNPDYLNDGVSFQDDVIIIKKQSDLKVYSSRCTHLGCKISHAQNNQLICPCHGSHFTMDGAAVKGPAIKPLKVLDYTKNNETGEITIYVS